MIAFQFVIEELTLRPEVPELQRQVNGNGYRARPDRARFRLVQLEVRQTIFVAETRQTVEIVDLLPGEDRQTV